MRAIGLLLCWLAGCATATAGAGVASDPQPTEGPADGLRGLDYTFRIDAGLSRLSARLCFRGQAPPRLVYGSKPAVLLVRDPQQVSDRGVTLPSPRPLPLVNDRIELGEMPEDSCVTYEVDVRAAVDGDHLLVAYPCERGVVTSTELFLWRPQRRAAGLAVTAQFELPEGVRVSVPWRRDPQDARRYLLDETAFAFIGRALFGEFDEQTVDVPSGVITVVSPPGYSDAQRGWIATWLENAGQVVSLPTGHFPVPQTQAIVLPTSPNPFPIRFGHTGRAGGGSILFFMPTDLDLPSLRDDWIAVHEFAHLLHPFVRKNDAWLSEGLATYLQEVLRVRAGMLDANQAWQRMFEGAKRGRDAEGSLRAETERMPYAHNYERVYWAGAAIVLMADVELRRRSQGRHSLDTALAGLRQWPELRLSSIDAAGLLSALDRATGTTAFRDAAAPFLEGDALPDLTKLYRELGLLDARGGERVQVRDDAPLAAIRDAIMAPASRVFPLNR